MTAAADTVSADVRPRSQLVDSCVVFGISVAVQAAYVVAVPITSTLDSGPLYGPALNGSFPDGILSFLTIPLIARLTGTMATGDLTGYFAAQSIFAAVMPLMLFAALSTISRITAWIGTAIFVISVTPFFYSQWLMTEHHYIFGVTFVIFAFAVFVRQPGWWRALLLVGALLFAMFSRSNGLLLPIIVAIAYAGHIVLTPKQRSLRSLLIVGVALISTVGLAYGINRIMAVQAGEGMSTTPRFLFCNLYGHATEGADNRRLAIAGEPAERLLKAIRETEARTPAIFAEFVQRWPGNYARFAGNPDGLADAIAANADGGPGMDSTNHTYCWLILRALDDAYGTAETNAILMALWQDGVLRQRFGYEHYLTSVFEYFFERPDVAYHGTTHGTGPNTVPQANPYSVTPRMYAQLAYVSDDPTLVAASVAINSYWLWFMVTVTPWLSVLGAIGMLGLLNAKTRALVLICLGIALYHALINAITNVTDVRYISPIYPALSALAAVTVAGAIGLVRRVMRRR